MTRAMYDSVTAARLPADAKLVGAYVDGMYANEAAVRARCPQARVVTITVRGEAGADVIDCETGDATPAEAAAWAAAERAAGRLPTIYCNLSTWPAVKAAVAAQHVTSVSYWIAHYDGQAVMVDGAVAKQYQERTDQNLDYSIAADYWPGVDPPVTAQAASSATPLPPRPHPAYPGHVLHHGMTTDPAVDTVQRYFNIPVTRRFDDLLAQKVAEFRRTHRIPGAAEVDAAVWAAMFP
jgi:hypothetical protein